MSSDWHTVNLRSAAHHPPPPLPLPQSSFSSSSWSHILRHKKKTRPISLYILIAKAAPPHHALVRNNKIYNNTANTHGEEFHTQFNNNLPVPQPAPTFADRQTASQAVGESEREGHGQTLSSGVPWNAPLPLPRSHDKTRNLI